MGCHTLALTCPSWLLIVVLCREIVCCQSLKWLNWVVTIKKALWCGCSHFVQARIPHRVSLLKFMGLLGSVGRYLLEPGELSYLKPVFHRKNTNNSIYIKFFLLGGPNSCYQSLKMPEVSLQLKLILWVKGRGVWDGPVANDWLNPWLHFLLVGRVNYESSYGHNYRAMNQFPDYFS